MYENVGNLLQTLAEKNKNKTALYIRRIFRIDRYSYASLYEHSQKVGAFLEKHNIHKGDKVLIWSPNMPEWVIAYFGCLLQGVVVVPVNVHTSSETLQRYIDQTKPKLLFVSQHIDDIPPDETVKKIFLEELIEQIEKLKTKEPATVKKDDLAEIVYTSGTTGNPKGLLITHKNILAQLESLLTVVPENIEYRLLSILPLSHIMEQLVGLFLPLNRGGTIYYLPQINTITITKALRKYKITHLGVVPQILRMLLDKIEYKVEKAGKKEQFVKALKLAPYLPIPLRRILFRDIHKNLGGCLEIFACGSAPLEKSLAQKWELLGMKVVEGYGASETTNAVTTNTIQKRNLGTVGKVLPNMQVKISAEGEILVKGDNVTQGYFKNEEKTKETFTQDGFFRTGDVGRFDEEGYLHITGRIKFRIVTAAGAKVYPEDIEKKLNNHPLVKDSCVVGVDKGQGETVHAVVLCKDTLQRVSPEEIIKDVNKTLEQHQQIMTFSTWPQKDFPRLHTLKVNRKEVQEAIDGGGAAYGPVATDPYVESASALTQIISKICKMPPEKIHKNTNLFLDLNLDSLKRVALVSMIEEEYGAIVKEELITTETTVAQLEKLITTAPKEGGDIPELLEWPFHPFVVKAREFFRQLLIFPVQNIFVTKFKVLSKKNLADIKSPAIFVFNHVGHYDSLLVLRALTKELRMKQAGVGDVLVFRNWWQTFILHFFGNIYPIDKWGGGVKGTLELATDILDKGWSILISPEGAISEDGKLRKLKKGAAMLAIEAGVPIIPFHIEGYRKIYPKIIPFPHWPEGRGPVTVKIGKPLYFDRKATYEAATKKLRDTFLSM